MKYLYIVFIAFVIVSCKNQNEKSKLFSLIPSSKSGLVSSNTIKHTEDFNIFSYRNFFNGAGVAIGDVNNDGLTDVYLTNNMTDNKLFINKGEFVFKDITKESGIKTSNKWSTGVVMVDINYDGFLDIYVCNAGYEKGKNQENELFINNGDLTFTERAEEYNLNNNGYTTHTAFFDYDLDGDLDAYILNNSFIPVNTLNYSNKRDLMAKDWPVKDFLKGGGDQLLRNDGDKFVDVSEESGIYNSLIGFGLGVTIGDINNDGYPDIYVSNDFFERDYLYINQQNGTFKEDIKSQMRHISMASMGADMADINNDGYSEIFVTEMLPKTDYRVKTITNFEQYNVLDLKLKKDFYYQYMHNTLQLNNKNSTFSEISWYSGVSASDWSWGALMFDANNDGFRDIYVCNGIPRDVTDQDFIDFFANDVIQKMALTGEKEEISAIIEKMPSNPIVNNFFINQGNLIFKEKGAISGFTHPSFSNGASYGDLDNDGDLDLIVSNTNQEVFLYRNNSEKLHNNQYVSIQLTGSGKNSKAIGSKVFVYANGQVYNTELMPSRGFQSSVDYKIVLGLGSVSKVDSLLIKWYDNSATVLYNLSTDTLFSFEYEKLNKKMNKISSPTDKSNPYFEEIDAPFTKHQEDQFVDFYKEGLIIKMLSKEGPKAAKGDVNGDGFDDVFIGGASRQSARLFLAKGKGFIEKNSTIFNSESIYEDTSAEFLDVDGDGDLDLFVGSGGNNAPKRSRMLQDRIYLNDGFGNFTRKPRALPMNGFNTSVAVPIDFDQDGDLDIFVGSRSIPNVYGIAPPNFLYKNDGKGNFKLDREQNDPAFTNLGMVTDAKLVDINNDNAMELIVVGEWEYPKIFTVASSQFKLLDTNLKNYSGWWYAIESDDVDHDGDQDLILGNRGENFYFSGTFDNPAKLWLSDFDENGTNEKIITHSIDGKDMPVALKNELTSQIVSLKKKNLSHTDYAKKAIQYLFTKKVLEQAQIKTGNYFKSIVALNQGGGNFNIIELPKEVQFSCVNDIVSIDVNGDSYNDLILAGNDSGFTPQFSSLDASYGHVLLNDKEGNFNLLDNAKSGFSVKGDVKQLISFSNTSQKSLLILINNQKPKMFNLVNTK